MRREQVLKLCANHRIVPGMHLAPMTSAESSWCWHAKDFSEVEMREEHLCARFKSNEISLKFKVCFDTCQKQLETEKETAQQVPQTAPKDKDAAITALQMESASSLSAAESVTLRSLLLDEDAPEEISRTGENNKGSLSEMFKSTAGQWDCSACYVKNSSSTTHCVACKSPRAVAETARPHSAQAPVPDKAAGVVLSSSASLSSLFKAKEGEWSCEACYVKNKSGGVKCVACEATKPGSRLPPVVDATKGGDQAPPLSSFTFSSQGGFSFGGHNTPSSQTAASAGGFSQTFNSDNSFLSTTSVGTPQEPTGGFKFPMSTGSLTFGPLGKTAVDVGKENTAPVFGFAKSSTQGAGILSTPNVAAPVFGGGVQGTPTAPGFGFIKPSVPPVFGAGVQGTPTAVSVFGFAKPSAPVFGAGVQQSTPAKSSTPLFGSAILETPTATKPSVPLFGSVVHGTPTAAKPSAQVFDAGVLETPTAPVFALAKSSAPIFGGGAQGMPKATDKNKVDIPPPSSSFGVSSKQPVFGFNKIEPSSTAKPAAPLFAFIPSSSTASTGFVFGTLVKPTTQPDAAAVSNTSVTVTTSEKPNTFASFLPQTPIVSKLKMADSNVIPDSPSSPDGGLYKNDDDEGVDIHFEPVVRMPDNVVIVTGEEDEDALYEHSAKLYRFVDNEWKERGTGEVKILRHRGTSSVRLLMRREKFLKICLNHAIKGDMELKAMANGQVWIRLLLLLCYGGVCGGCFFFFKMTKLNNVVLQSYVYQLST